jgi:hypothetical protein
MPTEAVFSQNRWPASPSPSKIGVRRFAINLQKGLDSIDLNTKVAKPLLEMIQWWDANISPVKVIHGHSWREVRGKEGTAEYSNHASGTAIDINPDDHPLGAEGTIPADKIPALLAKAQELGLRWGGSYRGRKDEMHFEWIKTPGSTSPAVALANTHYIPPKDRPWHSNPYFYALAGTTLLTLVGVPLLIARSRS